MEFQSTNIFSDIIKFPDNPPSGHLFVPWTATVDIFIQRYVFTVIIPVHNKYPYLDRAVYSVLNQEHEEFELILVDDASSDGSESKITEYSDPRIRVYKREIPGPGGYAARNIGIKKAKFNWIAFLDADDEWKVDHLNAVFKAIRSFPGIQIFSTLFYNHYNEKQTKSFDVAKSKTEQYQKYSLIDYLHRPALISTNTIVIRKDLILRSGAFPEGRHSRGGDQDTWIRILHNARKAILIKRYTAVYYRNIPMQVTQSSGRDRTILATTETAIRICKDCNSIRLKRAFDRFHERAVWGIMTKSVRSNDKLPWSRLNLIQYWDVRMKLMIKVLIYWMLYKLRCKFPALIRNENSDRG